MSFPKTDERMISPGYVLLKKNFNLDVKTMNASSESKSRDSQKDHVRSLSIGKRAHRIFCAQKQQLLQLRAHNMIVSTASHCRGQAISSVMIISLFARIQRLIIFPTGCFPQHFYSTFLAYCF